MQWREGSLPGRGVQLHVRRVVDPPAPPVLLLHGDADRDVAPDQSRDFYRVLRDRGVETQFVRYPGAAHGPHDPRHIRDVLERRLAWFVDRL